VQGRDEFIMNEDRNGDLKRLILQLEVIYSGSVKWLG